MNTNEIVSNIQTGYISVLVKFYDHNNDLSEKTYSYKALASLGIKEGDQLIVPVRGKGLAIVVVESIEENPALDYNTVASYSWVVQRIDLTQWNATMEAERALTATVAAMLRKNAREQYIRNLNAELGADAEKLLRLADMTNSGEVKNG